MLVFISAPDPEEWVGAPHDALKAVNERSLQLPLALPAMTSVRYFHLSLFCPKKTQKKPPQ